MNPRPPDFDELVGSDLPPEDRERLRRAHEALVAAGAPPELAPELDAVPWPEAALAPLGFRRRRQPVLRRSPLVAFAVLGSVALAAFLFGQATGSKSASFDSVRRVEMRGTRLAPDARLVILLGRPGAGGNWPLLVNVAELPPVASGGYYDLWLSRKGKPVGHCGSFNTRPGRDTTVRMSAAYSLRNGFFDGWVVTRHVSGERDSNRGQIFATTT